MLAASMFLGADSITAPLLTVLLIIILAFRTGIRAGEFCRRNIFILIFALLFSAFAFIPGSQPLPGSSGGIFSMFLKIIIIFNLFYLGSRWIGRHGYYSLLNRVSSQGIRLYLLLLGNTVTGFVRNSRLILYQLRSRIGTGIKNRFIFLRYYIQNLIIKDLYSLHLNHAAIVSRLHGDIEIITPDEKMELSDILIGLASAAILTVTAAMRIRGII